MKPKRRYFGIFLFLLLVFVSGCDTDNEEAGIKTGRKPLIDPDYSDVTIPTNIAPMNFIIKEVASFFEVTATSSTGNIRINIKSSDGKILFPEKKWQKLIKDSNGDSITIQVKLVITISREMYEKFLT